MVRKFPSDEALVCVYKDRMNEGADEPFDMYGEKRLGDAVKQADEQELTEAWYESLAQKLVNDYRHTTEASWVPVAVNNFVSSAKATAGVDVDAIKLLEAVYDVIDVIEQDAIARCSPLKETRDALLNQIPQFVVEEADVDEVTHLVESLAGTSDYLSRAQQVLSVTMGPISLKLRRFMLSEGMDVPSRVPMSGHLSHGRGFRAIDERALDLYVESWNRRRSVEGSPLRLSWAIDGDDSFTFDVRAR
jgi:hypothetical protein